MKGMGGRRKVSYKEINEARVSKIPHSIFYESKYSTETQMQMYKSEWWAKLIGTQITISKKLLPLKIGVGGWTAANSHPLINPVDSGFHTLAVVDSHPHCPIPNIHTLACLSHITDHFWPLQCTIQLTQETCLCQEWWAVTLPTFYVLHSMLLHPV